MWSPHCGSSKLQVHWSWSWSPCQPCNHRHDKQQYIDGLGQEKVQNASCICFHELRPRPQQQEGSGMPWQLLRSTATTRGGFEPATGPWSQVKSIKHMYLHPRGTAKYFETCHRQSKVRIASWGLKSTNTAADRSPNTPAQKNPKKSGTANDRVAIRWWVLVHVVRAPRDTFSSRGSAIICCAPAGMRQRGPKLHFPPRFPPESALTQALHGVKSRHESPIFSLDTANLFRLHLLLGVKRGNQMLHLEYGLLRSGLNIWNNWPAIVLELSAPCVGSTWSTKTRVGCLSSFGLVCLHAPPDFNLLTGPNFLSRLVLEGDGRILQGYCIELCWKMLCRLDIALTGWLILDLHLECYILEECHNARLATALAARIQSSGRCMTEQSSKDQRMKTWEKCCALCNVHFPPLSTSFARQLLHNNGCMCNPVALFFCCTVQAINMSHVQLGNTIQECEGNSLMTNDFRTCSWPHLKHAASPYFLCKVLVSHRVGTMQIES